MSRGDKVFTLRAPSPEVSEARMLVLKAIRTPLDKSSLRLPMPRHHAVVGLTKSRTPARSAAGFVTSGFTTLVL
ncbi:hypothetical protein GUJ93_ZPchr0003g17540 [Zizania palustris]|uniref:Uncharacterized protein n=1 Tax=Zizania palustris TaxID=103762 RepID=A0A8J5VW63_ZIZPA|nr:hypothetical protein GUJ93_ZPchr0003g17540 [Zizania palustris]